MSDNEFPKLKWPLNRTRLNEQDGLILLAYDILWRVKNHAVLSHLEEKEAFNLNHDINSNMISLGRYLRKTLTDDIFEDPYEVRKSIDIQAEKNFKEFQEKLLR